MSRLFVPTRGVESWRGLLADPERHWKQGRSAYELAHSWETEDVRKSPRGLPAKVAAVLDTSPRTEGAVLVIGIPEHRVALPGGGHASQTDLWALLRVGSSFVSMAVEAKAGEMLGPVVAEWRDDPNPRTGKPMRLDAIRRHLGLDHADLDPIRYQLLHRAASAVIEAGRVGASAALLAVHSFSREGDKKSLEDVRTFARLYDVEGEEDRVVALSANATIPLYLAWISDAPAAGDAAS